MSDAEPRSRPCVALIAHDSKKDELIGFARRHRGFLAGCELVATQATAQLLRDRLGLAATAVRAGPAGGDLQIAARLLAGEIRAVFFLRDVAVAQPHEVDILALLRVCDVCNVPYATNIATARLLAQELFGGGRPAPADCAGEGAGIDDSRCRLLGTEA